MIKEVNWWMIWVAVMAVVIVITALNERSAQEHKFQLQKLELELNIKELNQHQ